MDPRSLAVVTTCFDRWSFLQRTLPGWRRLPGAPPIFVATYAGDPVPDWLSGVHLVVVDAEPFHLSRLRNCAAAEARAAVDPEWLLFMDADIEVEDPVAFTGGLAAEPSPDYVLDSPHALVDEYVVLRDDDPERLDAGKRGTAFVRTDLFFEIGGYDQRLIGWGIEDRNLYQRLAGASDRAGYYDRRAIAHLEHPFQLRSLHNPRGRRFFDSLLTNLHVHTSAFDPLGDAWRDELGYPEDAVGRSWLAPPADAGATDAHAAPDGAP